jgi:DNA-binding MarR family transcriptional regulator
MNNRPEIELPVETAAIGDGQGGMLGLLGVAQVLQDRLEAALESVGLSAPKFFALQRLVEAGAPVSLSSLAERQRCVRSNITQLVDRLESDGLVKRVDDPADRRAVLATITTLGEQRFAAATTAIANVQTELAARVAPEDRESFLRVLAAIRKPWVFFDSWFTHGLSMRSTIHAVNGSIAEFGEQRQKTTDELSIQERPIRRTGRTDAVKKFDNHRPGTEGDSEMSRQRSNIMTQSLPAPLRPALLRAGLVLAVIAAMAAFTVRMQAEQTPTPVSLSASTSDLR